MSPRGYPTDLDLRAGRVLNGTERHHGRRRIDRVHEIVREVSIGAILAAFDTGIGTGSVALGAVIGGAGFPAAYGTAAVLAAFSIPAFVLLERRFLGDGVREKLPV